MEEVLEETERTNSHENLMSYCDCTDRPHPHPTVNIIFIQTHIYLFVYLLCTEAVAVWDHVNDAHVQTHTG